MFSGTLHSATSKFVDSNGDETPPVLNTLFDECTDPIKDRYWFPTWSEKDIQQRVVGPAVAQVVKARDKNPNEKVFLVGFSRGGMAALLVARALQNKDIDVNYLGVIDPVYTGFGMKYIAPLYPDNRIPRPGISGGVTEKASISTNVLSAEVMYTPGYERTGPTANDKGQFGVERIGIETTFQRLPINADRKSIKITTYNDVGHYDASYNSKIRNDFWKSALDAGVPLRTRTYPRPIPDNNPPLTPEQAQQIYQLPF